LVHLGEIRGGPDWSQPANKGSHKHFLLCWTLHLGQVRLFF